MDKIEFSYEARAFVGRLLRDVGPTIPSFLGGSRGSKVSSVTDASDWDVIIDTSVLSHERWPDLDASLAAAGFTRDLDDEQRDALYDGSSFVSWRHPNGVNALLYRDHDEFEATKQAVEIIRAFNFTRREDRIAVNQILRDRLRGDQVTDATNVGQMLQIVGSEVVQGLLKKPAR